MRTRAGKINRCILRFSECVTILSGVDSGLSFEQQMALHPSQKPSMTPFCIDLSALP